MNIINKRNCYIEAVETAIKEGSSIIIFGGGLAARTIYNFLKAKIGDIFDVTAFAVNDSFYDPKIHKELYGKPIIKISDIDREDPNLLLLLGYTHSTYYDGDVVIPSIKGKLILADWSSTFDRTDDGKCLDYEYYSSHKDEFKNLESLLCDEKSKQVLEAYLNQRISGDLAYLNAFYDTNQYFDSDIVNLDRVNCFVDCGAYIGDTYQSFIANYKKQTGNEYTGKAYLWEMNVENIENMRQNLIESDKVIVIPKGVFNKKEKLYFSGETNNGKIEGTGDIQVEVDTIDNIIKERIDFIKMDVEGAEYSALEGAKKHIIQDHPVIAVCMYHKRDDLLKIPNLIKEYYEGYSFYLRHYHKYALELVLYAIPN